MKKIITGTALAISLSNSLCADCIDYLIDGGNSAEYAKCLDNERRNTLSPEERAVEDLENENRLEQRRRNAQRQKESLEVQDKVEAQAEEDTTWGKVKSFF